MLSIIVGVGFITFLSTSVLAAEIVFSTELNTLAITKEIEVVEKEVNAEGTTFTLEDGTKIFMEGEIERVVVKITEPLISARVTLVTSQYFNIDVYSYSTTAPATYHIYGKYNTPYFFNGYIPKKSSRLVSSTSSFQYIHNYAGNVTGRS